MARSMKSSWVMRTALLIGGMMWAGCAGVGGEPPRSDPPNLVAPAPPGQPPPEPDGDWVPEQGVHLLGAAADGITEPTRVPYLSASVTPVGLSTFTLSLLPASQGAHLSATDGTNTYS